MVKNIEKLKFAIRGSGISQEYIAKELGVSRQTVNIWLNSYHLDDEVFYEICKMIEKNPNDFLLETDEVLSTGGKIKQVRKSLKMNQKNFADKLNIEQSKLSRIENDLQRPSIDVIKDIAKITNKPASYFLDEEFEEISPSPSDNNIIGDVEFTDIKISPISVKLRLVTSVRAGEDTVLIQNGNRYISIPWNLLPIDLREWKQVNIDEKFAIVKVVGDSMLPEYKPNDLLITERDSQIINGKEYIITIDEHIIVKTVFKRNGDYLLISENDRNYEPRTLTEEFLRTHDVSIEHRVIYLMRDYS